MGDEYDIVTANEDDKERMAEFMRQHFLTQSALSVASGAPPNRRTEEIYGLRFLSQGKSLLAVSRDDGRILGLIINYETRSDDKTPEDYLNCLSHEAYTKIEDFVHHLESAVDIWKLTGTDRAFYVNILSVDTATRGRGIAKVLMERSRDMARSMGYPMMWIICTSIYSIRICRNMGMDAVYTLPFSEYKDEDGEVIFNIPYPHTEAVLFVQKLNPER
ncbi:hypothetical protein ANN_15020 [Periplaneta americana]|uniref:N-acetyltransferase domain-containing protein n=1 Tax=Periplaneta americana TaxID=6978 RepID=A0ABQ8SXW1_PERAM|nr:hypothetical protein ANN_15020 [Periplaneta americana]